jgi:4-amino-4-deoxy-L-arabinose transferase-like glycosyltransferase
MDISSPEMGRKKRGTILAAMIVFFMAYTGLWIYFNHGLAQWDDAWYLTDSLRMFDCLHDQGLSGWLHYFFFVAQERYKAPLICALPTAAYLIFGRNYAHAIYMNLIYIPWLLIGIYTIADQFRGPRVGLLAAFIAGTLPQFYGLSTWFLVEYGLTTYTVLAVVCLIKSENLTRLRWVALFSAMCGLGLMQKILMPVYVLPLAIYFLYCWIRRSDRDRGATLRMTVCLVLPALVIAGPWYIINFEPAVHRAIFSAYSHQEADLHGTGDPLSLEAMFKYIINIINEGCGASYFIGIVVVGWILLFFKINGLSPSSAPVLPPLPPGEGWGEGEHRVVPAISYFSKSEIRTEEKEEAGSARPTQATELPPGTSLCRLLVLWGAPFIIFFFGRNKGVRFVAPLLPIFVIGFAIALDRLISLGGKWGISIVAVILATGLFCQIQNGFQPIPNFAFAIPQDPTPTHASHGLRFVAGQIGTVRAVNPDKWPLLEVLAELQERSPNQFLDVMTGWDSFHFNLNNLSLAAAQAKLPFRISSSSYYLKPDDLKEDINKVNFFLFRLNAEPENRGWNSLLDVAMAQVRNHERFERIRARCNFPTARRW